MKFLFLLSTLDDIKPDCDTSFIFMVGAQKHGHEVFACLNGDISLNDGEVKFQVIPVIVNKENSPHIIKKDKITLTDKEIHAVFIRTDPPFDSQYLMNTWLLDRLPKNVAIINNPSGVRTVNEKIWATQFTKFIPKTLITAKKVEFLKFLETHNEVIIKPTDGFGGAGVFRLKKDSQNINVSFETLTNNESKEIIIQAYIPAAEKGDKRILLLNGEPLGAVLRVHGKDDHRNNFYAGGKAVATEITQRDLEVIQTLKPHLIKLGLYFVGIDMLGDYLIEVNVTSPTCIQEMNQLYNLKLEDKVINFTEKLINKGNK